MYMYMYTHIYSPSNWTSSGRFFCVLFYTKNKLMKIFSSLQEYLFVSNTVLLKILER
uniref:Uncharacterized protein n=1 Tax=Anguilla anguilla TaxID=7936 RepID=A0A0E9TM82_ANGAN